MKHKVLGSVFVLAIALGLFSAVVRPPAPRSSPASAGQKGMLAKILKGFNATPESVKIAMDAKTDLVRPLSSYQVRESDIEGGMGFRTMAYSGRVSKDGFSFGNKSYTIDLGSPRLRQGAVTLESTKPAFAHPEQAVGDINHGAFVERYVFENTRVEQLFTVPAKVGTGALEMRIPVTSPLPGAVVQHHPEEGGFKEIQFMNGGLAFTDEVGATRLSYYGAIAMDSSGLRQPLTPRFENREIVLTVSAEFMNRAVYPVVIDPWFDLAGSGSGGGVTHNGSVSDRPALVMSGSGLPWVAWSDNSATGSSENFEIYVTAWTGFQWINYAGGLDPGGISKNSGKSTNPTICLGALDGFPMVAWQDDTNGYVQIYCRAVRRSGGWAEMAGSANGTGLSRYIGPMQHPSIASLIAIVADGSGSGGTNLLDVPIVAYEDATSTSQINVMIYYPGTDPDAPDGWYQLTPGGSQTSTVFFDPTATPDYPNLTGVSEYPSLIIDNLGNPVVAWQETVDGNYEIYVKTYTLNNNGFFAMVPSVSSIGFADVFPSGGNWVGISGSAGPGGISATATMSQYPSVCADNLGGTNNISVVWQETMPVVPGLQSQIYMKRSVAGGAFAEVLGSATGNGISQSPGNATDPVVTSGGNYIGVAWVDDSSGNPEIYARRISLNGATGALLSTQWEQIGFQGSAAPAIGADLLAPTGGLSKTPTYSLRPAIQMDFDGNPTVVWMDGLNAAFDVYLKQFAPNGPGVISGSDFIIQMRQTDGDPLAAGVDIPVGGTIANTTVYLSARIFTEDLLPAGSALRIEVEAKPFNENFNGTHTSQSQPAIPDTSSATPANIAVVPVTGLANFNYHWQCRTVDQMGRHSPWFTFGTLANTSFRIDSTFNGGGGGGGGSAPPPPLVTSTSSKGKCGLLGLDAVVLLGVLGLIRRRRFSK